MARSIHLEKALKWEFVDEIPRNIKGETMILYFVCPIKMLRREFAEISFEQIVINIIIIIIIIVVTAANFTPL